MSDPFDMFRLLRDPARDNRILSTIEPSDFIPSPGSFFRVRFASIADRSHMMDVWECLGFQSHTAICRKVLDMYNGLTAKSIGQVLSFVHGDVIFYDCTEAWNEYQKRSAVSENDAH